MAVPLKFSTFISSVSTDFNLSPKHISCLETHYLLHWSAAWLLKQAKDDLTTIEHNGIIYLINWQNLDPSLIYGQVRISFRKPFCCSFGFAIIEQIDL